MKLFISNLSKDVSKEELTHFFSSFGKVTETQIFPSPGDDSLGFGFVKMKEPPQGKAALEKLDGKPLKDHNISVTCVEDTENTEKDAGQTVARPRMAKFFSEEDETDLVALQYLSLKAVYYRIKDTLKDDHALPPEALETLHAYFKVGSENATRKQNNHIEQLLVHFYDSSMLDVELARRMADAKKALSPAVRQFYETTLSDKNSKTEKRTLLSRLLSDLQWRYEIQKLSRKYSRQIRKKIGWILGFGILAFLIPTSNEFLVFFKAHTEPGTIRHFLSNLALELHDPHIITAIKCGWLGAGFSMMITLNRRMKEIEYNLDALKVQRHWLYHMSRAIIGISSALILLYFFQTGILPNEIFPQWNGTAFDNMSLLVIWCFIAGFSENLVPNILSRTEKKIDPKSPTPQTP